MKPNSIKAWHFLVTHLLMAPTKISSRRVVEKDWISNSKPQITRLCANYTKKSKIINKIIAEPSKIAFLLNILARTQKKVFCFAVLFFLKTGDMNKHCLW